jgi:glycosyltransferase involved in cell wall biosynthesis
MKEYIQQSSQKWLTSIVSHPTNSEILHDSGANFIPMEIERKVSPLSDLKILFRLISLFRHERFDLIHSIMPKTGFLAMLAGWLSGVPNRVHTFTGQVWANKTGWKKKALKAFDRLIVFLSTQILVDSPSQRDFLISEGILKPGQGKVIGNGSICGVNSKRFHPDPQTKSLIRQELNIDAKATVILFLGRLNRDKGMLDLANAFAKVASEAPETVLLLVGAEEDVSYTEIQKICGDFANHLRRVNFTPNPEKYMAAADIFCLPSYREGFGQSIIEAAASEVPTVASRIYGVTDAVEDGVSGILFPAGDIDQLQKNLLTLIKDREMREKMGLAAKKRSLELFSSSIITREIIQLYQGLIET